MSNKAILLHIVSTDFLALHLFCFNIREHGRQILYFNLHVDRCKFHYRRPHAAVRRQVVHRCTTTSDRQLFTSKGQHNKVLWPSPSCHKFSRLRKPRVPLPLREKILIKTCAFFIQL